MIDARPRPGFAHASEAELARILDFYEVAWQYEPHTFPILYDRDGAVLESFSPDFYLPDLDLYVEITTLKQRLVRKKNRKLRRLRELYPDVRVKLLYARDFRALLLKYGRIALADGLSGAEGQSTPPRRPRPATVPSGARAATTASPSARVAAGPAVATDRGDRVDLPPEVGATSGRARRARRTRSEARARLAARAAARAAAAPGQETTA